MRRLRFFCESIDTESILDPVESNHLSRVMRVSEGQTVELFDGKGTLAEGTVTRAHKKQAVVTSHNIRRSRPLKNKRTILAISFAKTKRFDWIVEKCTELGADHIAAVQFERTVKQGSSAAIERFQKIAITAAKQCGRLFLPEITGPARLPDTLVALMETYTPANLFYGDPEGPTAPKVFDWNDSSDRIIVIGPEGGFTENEIAYLKSVGATGVSINKNILRIETAATAFCALLNTPDH